LDLSCCFGGGCFCAEAEAAAALPAAALLRGVPRLAAGVLLMLCCWRCCTCAAADRAFALSLERVAAVLAFAAWLIVRFCCPRLALLHLLLFHTLALWSAACACSQLLLMLLLESRIAVWGRIRWLSRWRRSFAVVDWAAHSRRRIRAFGISRPVGCALGGGVFGRSFGLAAVQKGLSVRSLFGCGALSAGRRTIRLRIIRLCRVFGRSGGRFGCPLLAVRIARPSFVRGPIIC